MVLNWLLIMTAVSLPFPDYSLVSKFIIVLGLYWLFLYNSLKNKIYHLKQYKYEFLSISVLFWLPVFGLFYSDNLNAAFKDLVLKIPFLLLPLIIFSIPQKLPFNLLHKYFAYSTVLVSISAILQVLYFKYLLGIDYSFYHEFSFFTHKHTTYFGLFISISIIYFAWNLLNNKGNLLLNIIGLLILFMILYINANRLSFLAVIFGLTIISLYKLSVKSKFFIGFIGTLLFLLFTQSMFYQNRIRPLVNDTNGYNELNYKKKHWQAIWQTIKHNNIWVGAGTESHRDYLYQKYKDNDYRIAYQEKYNAHNQLLEITLDFGLLGLLFFLASIFYHFSLINKNIYFLAIYISITLFMMTESILERQNGIIIWALFVSLILRNISNNNVSLTKI